MLSQVGVKELTGNNDGKEVEMYQRATKSPKGSAWCASFVKWCFDQAGVKTTITAWSPTAPSKDIVYSNLEFKKVPKVGDVFTLYSISKKRIVHTGFFYKQRKGITFETVEGNTSANGAVVGSVADVNGNGVYRKIRSYHQIYNITRWE